MGNKKGVVPDSEPPPCPWGPYYCRAVESVETPELLERSGSPPANAPVAATLTLRVKVTGPVTLQVTVQRRLAKTLVLSGIPEWLMATGDAL